MFFSTALVIAASRYFLQERNLLSLSEAHFWRTRSIPKIYKAGYFVFDVIHVYSQLHYTQA